MPPNRLLEERMEACGGPLLLLTRETDPLKWLWKAVSGLIGGTDELVN